MPSNQPEGGETSFNQDNYSLRRAHELLKQRGRACKTSSPSGHLQQEVTRQERVIPNVKISHVSSMRQSQDSSNLVNQKPKPFCRSDLKIYQSSGNLIQSMGEQINPQDKAFQMKHSMPSLNVSKRNLKSSRTLKNGSQLSSPQFFRNVDSKISTQKHQILRLMTIYGIDIDEQIQKMTEGVDITIQENIERQMIDFASTESPKPKIIGFIDQNSASNEILTQKERDNYLKKNYSFVSAIKQIAFPGVNFKNDQPTTQTTLLHLQPVLLASNLQNQDQSSFDELLTETLQKYSTSSKHFNSYISTDIEGNCIFTQSMQFQRIFFVKQKPFDCVLFSVVESIQVTSADSQPIFDVLTNVLEFVFQSVVQVGNRRQVQGFLKRNLHSENEVVVVEDTGTISIEQKLMERVEFIGTVLFQHLFFQEDIVNCVSLQFAPKDGVLVSTDYGLKCLPGHEFNLRNAYKNGRDFKIEGFNFALLFQKIKSIHIVLKLLRALFLEKKIIIIKEDVSDIALIIQGLLTLFQPFKWGYAIINSLPAGMAEALESPMPFLIGVQRSVWDSECNVEMMDNAVYENFVIVKLDDICETNGIKVSDSRGLGGDVYESQQFNVNDVQFPYTLRRDIEQRHYRLCNIKDELITQLTGKQSKPTKNGSQGMGSPKHGSPISKIEDITNRKSPLGKQSDGGTGSKDFATIDNPPTGMNPQKKSEKGYSPEKAEELYWVWFQLKMKQAFHHLFLHMLGDITQGFRPTQELLLVEQRKGGPEKLSCSDIFDTQKYISKVKKETEDYKFVEAFVKVQAFATFVEEIYSSIRQREIQRKQAETQVQQSGIKTEVQMFQHSIRYLKNHASDPDSSSVVKFNEKILKQLRKRQNEVIDEVFKEYKKIVPFKFQFVMDEYIKQIATKHFQFDEEQIQSLDKQYIKEMAEKALSEIQKSETNKEFTTSINSKLLTPMKGIDYDKARLYLNQLIKKSQKQTLRKILKSQDSKNRDLESRQDNSEYGLSENKFGNHGQNLTTMNSNHIPNHRAILNRGSISNADENSTGLMQDYDLSTNLRDSQNVDYFLNNNKKASKSSRRENIISLSQQMQFGGIHKSRSYRMELTQSNSKGVYGQQPQFQTINDGLEKNQILGKNQHLKVSTTKAAKSNAKYNEFINARDEINQNKQRQLITCGTPSSQNPNATSQVLSSMNFSATNKSQMHLSGAAALPDNHLLENTESNLIKNNKQFNKTKQNFLMTQHVQNQRQKSTKNYQRNAKPPQSAQAVFSPTYQRQIEQKRGFKNKSSIAVYKKDKTMKDESDGNQKIKDEINWQQRPSTVQDFNISPYQHSNLREKSENRLKNVPHSRITLNVNKSKSNDFSNLQSNSNRVSIQSNQRMAPQESELFSPSKGKLTKVYDPIENNQATDMAVDHQEEIKRQYFSMSQIDEDDLVEASAEQAMDQEFEEVKIEEVKEVEIKESYHQKNNSLHIDQNTLNLQYLNSQILNSERTKGPLQNKEESDALFQYSNISSKNFQNKDTSGRGKQEEPITYQTAMSDQVSEGYHKFQVKTAGTQNIAQKNRKPSMRYDWTNLQRESTLSGIQENQNQVQFDEDQEKQLNELTVPLQNLDESYHQMKPLFKQKSLKTAQIQLQTNEENIIETHRMPQAKPYQSPQQQKLINHKANVIQKSTKKSDKRLSIYLTNHSKDSSQKTITNEAALKMSESKTQDVSKFQEHPENLPSTFRDNFKSAQNHVLQNLRVQTHTLYQTRARYLQQQSCKNLSSPSMPNNFSNTSKSNPSILTPQNQSQSRMKGTVKTQRQVNYQPQKGRLLSPSIMKQPVFSPSLRVNKQKDNGNADGVQSKIASRQVQKPQNCLEEEGVKMSMVSDVSQSKSDQKRDSKVHRVSKGSNQKEMKQKYKNKLSFQNKSQVVGNSFATRFQSTSIQSKIGLHAKQQNKNILAGTAQKSSSKEDDLSLIDDVVPDEIEPVSASMTSDVQQHPYQFNEIQKLDGSGSKPHGRKKSIFSQENFNVITPKKNESKMAQNGQKLNLLGVPEGERIDLNNMHRYYQGHQMMNSHTGDIDNEPKTPRSPNSNQTPSGKNSQSRHTSSQDQGKLT